MILPGISSIYVIKTSALPAHLRERSMAGETPTLFCNLVSIFFGHEAIASDNSESKDSGVDLKASLNFHSELLPFHRSKDNFAFVIKTSNGELFLLGTKEPPFPVVKITNSTSNPSEGKAGFEVDVEWPGLLIPLNSTSLSSF